MFLWSTERQTTNVVIMYVTVNKCNESIQRLTFRQSSRLSTQTAPTHTASTSQAVPTCTAHSCIRPVLGKPLRTPLPTNPLTKRQQKTRLISRLLYLAQNLVIFRRTLKNFTLTYSRLCWIHGAITTKNKSVLGAVKVLILKGLYSKRN